MDNLRKIIDLMDEKPAAFYIAKGPLIIPDELWKAGRGEIKDIYGLPLVDPDQPLQHYMVKGVQIVPESEVADETL